MPEISRVAWLGTILSLLLWAPSVRGQSDLRYAPKAGQSFAYQIEITVDLPSKTTTFKGITRYVVDAVNADQVRLTYTGGLSESSKDKGTDRGRGFPFGPPGMPFGPAGPRGPGGFGGDGFAGKLQTKNMITMSPLGNVLAMEGDSQLPYLLGNVSLLPFEALPAGNEAQWKYEVGINIEKKEQNGGPPFGPFGRFGPFNNGQADKNVQTGQETADYAVQSRNGGKAVIRKSYRLNKPAVGEDPALEIVGAGTWTFHLTDHLPDSLDFKQKLVITKPNEQVTIPVSLVYHRLSAEAIAKIDQENAARIQAMQQKAADDKAKAEAPLAPQEKADTLRALAGTDSTKLDAALRMLAGKSPKDPDSEIAAAIQSFLTHKNPSIRDLAKNAMRKWSPDFEKRLKLNEAYSSHMPVESTDREVDSATPLYVGQIVQFQESGPFWFAGEILELETGGKVKIRKRGFAPRELTLSRRNLQLAPEELEQPQKPASLSENAGGTRTWVDATGEHKIEATFLGVADGKVKLRRKDGKEIAVPLDRLCREDQQLAEQLQKKKSSNPFE